jgi:hypothetical protein
VLSLLTKGKWTNKDFVRRTYIHSISLPYLFIPVCRTGTSFILSSKYVVHPGLVFGMGVPLSNLTALKNRGKNYCLMTVTSGSHGRPTPEQSTINILPDGQFKYISGWPIQIYFRIANRNSDKDCLPDSLHVSGILPFRSNSGPVSGPSQVPNLNVEPFLHQQGKFLPTLFRTKTSILGTEFSQFHKGVKPLNCSGGLSFQARSGNFPSQLYLDVDSPSCSWEFTLLTVPGFELFQLRTREVTLPT